MSEVPAKHLVLVRHGESEGDVRRSLKNQPRSDMLMKHPRDEEQTGRGHEQSAAAGRWIARYILGMYGFERFDWQRVSPLIRTRQSADSLGLPGMWTDDDRLAERDRGKIHGMTKIQHRQSYPDSYEQMSAYPFHWTPPGGESLLRVSMRLGELVDDFMQSSATAALCMTHRDVLWAAHLPVDGVSSDRIEQIDTDLLHNGHIVHYTNVNPATGTAEPGSLLWKRSCTPWLAATNAQDWLSLPPPTGV